MICDSNSNLFLLFDWFCDLGLKDLMDYQQRWFGDSNNGVTCGDDSFETNRREEDGDQSRFEFFHFKSPSP